MTIELDCLELRPAGAEAAIIWMHGLGASYYDFAGVPPELRLPAHPRVAYVFPQAPEIPVTINGGMRMPAWYDIVSLQTRGTDRAGTERSARQLTALIDREVAAGIPPERIVVAGFSMGAAMAYHIGLRYPRRLAGIIALSGYLLLADSLAAEASQANRQTPVFAAHGRRDPMLPIALGVEARDVVRARGNPVEWHEYPIEHSVSPTEIADIGAWLRGVLTSEASSPSDR